MGLFSKDEQELAVGKSLAAVLPQNPRPWYRTKHLLALNLLLIGPLLSSSTYGYDGSLMNGLQSLPQWKSYFNHPTASQLGAINAMYPVGQFLGTLPATWLSDRYGRKVPIYVGFGLIFLSAGLSAGARDLAMLIVARLLVGMGSSFIALPSPVLIAELAYPTHRGKLAAFYYTNYFIGSIYAAWLTYGTRTLTSSWSWRLPALLQCSLPFVQCLIFLLFVPQSPRWLVAKDRHKEARQILNKYHAGGDEDSPLVDFTMKEMMENICLEQRMLSQSSYADLFSTKPNRKRTAIVMFLGFIGTWCGVAVISYYLTIVLNTIGVTSIKSQNLINGMLQVMNYVVAVASSMLVDRLGRRKLFITSAFGMLVAYICVTALSATFAKTSSSQAGHGVIAFIFIFQFFYDVGIIPLLFAYPLEIFPYTLRSRGLSASTATTFIGLTLGQSLNPIALERIGWKYYNVFIVILAIFCVVVVLYFPETRGKTLEEMAEIFGDEKTHAEVELGKVSEEHEDEEEDGKHHDVRLEAVRRETGMSR